MMEYAGTIQVGPGSSDTYEYTFYPEPRQLDASIQVVNAETTEPIPNAQIEVYSRNMANPYKPAFSVETNTNGYYNGTIPSTVAASYRYSIEAEGYATITGSGMTGQELDIKRSLFSHSHKHNQQM